MNGKIDDLLKEALIPPEKPDARLNQEILRKAAEGSNMRKPFLKTIPVVAAITVAVIATGSLTAYGAWKYLSTEQVIEETGDKKLADAFKEKGAVNINESQEYGDYKITLMGTVSGDRLSNYLVEDDGVFLTDRTYSVISIEKKDGSPMPDTSDEDYENNFLVSPFIKGEDPKFLNIYYMDGGCSNFVKDGVEYCVADHDNIEAFAGRGVYLGVLGDTFYDRDAYNFDKTTGEITRNENYKGINALFGLPLDKSKADEEKAKKLLAKWKNGSDSSNDSENPDNEEDTKAKNNTVDETDWNKIKKNCTLIKGSVKTYPASQYGEMLSYSSGVTDKNGTTKDNWLIAVDEYFKEDEYGTKVAGTLGDGENSVYIVIKRSRNGKITVSKYQD
ncbi:MAG: hypothetical protein K1W06_06445 [Lachnospiraceae bacterium]